MDFLDLVGRVGVPLAMALFALWSFTREKPLVVSGAQHRQQLADRDTEVGRLRKENDDLRAERNEQIDKLEERNRWMESRLLEGLDRERHVYDALDVPKPVGSDRRRRPA